MFWLHEDVLITPEYEFAREAQPENIHGIPSLLHESYVNRNLSPKHKKTYSTVEMDGERSGAKKCATRIERRYQILLMTTEPRPHSLSFGKRYHFIERQETQNGLRPKS